MDYHFLGKTGMQVGELCMGTMTFGREAGEKDSHRMRDCFAQVGGNLLGSANVYGRGASEEIVIPE